MIAVTGPLKVWTNDEGRVHFMTVPDEVALEIRAHAALNPRGFGSVRVECTIADITWRTSIFPQRSGGYFLPVKVDLCRRAGISAGDQVAVDLTLL